MDLERDTSALLQALQLSGVGVFECDHRSGVLRFCATARTVWGFSDSEQTKTHAPLNDWHIPPAIVRSTDPDGEPQFSFDHLVVLANGQQRRVFVRGVTLFEGAGHRRTAVRTVGTTIDVADRARIELSPQDSQFLSSLKEKLRGIVDPEEVQYASSLALGQRLNVNRCGYAEDGGDGDSLIVTRHYAAGVPSIAGRYPHHTFGTTVFRDLHYGEPHITVDTAADERLTAEQKHGFDNVQISAMINVPLIRSGRLVAVMFAHDVHRRVWTDEEIALIQAVATRTWEAAERARADAKLIQAQRRLLEQEDRLQLFIEHAPAAIAMFDRDMRYLVASRRFADDFGLPTHELIGRCHSDVFPDLPARWREVHQRCLTGEMVNHEADQFERADGSVMWLRWKACPWRNGSEEIGGMLLFSEVITERKQAEDRLRGNAETFHQLVANNPFGIYVVDADFRVAVISRGAHRLFEHVAPVIGRDFADVLRTLWTEPFATQAIDRFLHTLSTGEPFVSTRTIEQRGDIDAIEAYDWRIERIVLPDGRFGVVCYFYDLSDRLQWEERLRESEMRLDLATMAAGIGIHDYDVRTGAIVWDRRVREIWGIDADEPVGYETFATGLHPDDAPATHAAVTRALDPAGSGQFASEYRVINRRSGVTSWVAASGRVHFDEDRHPVRLIGTVQDISERKAVEATLRAFYDVSPLMMGTVELQPDGDIVPLYINPAMRRFFGLDPAETKGRSARTVGLPESTIALWRRYYEIARDTHAPVSFEYDHPSHRQSEPRTVTATVACLGTRASSGRAALCFIAEDVTVQRKVQRDLLAAVKALEDTDRRKDEFLATLSHELRNPLSPLQAAAGILALPQAGTHEQAHAMAVIQRQVRHLGLMLDDLLDVARITRGSLALRRERVTLASIIETALETARLAIETKSHRLIVRQPESPVWLDVDPLRMSQILTNLLTNASKYTPPGGVIELATRIDRGAVCISVHDNGIGIPKEAQARVFDMFTRAAGAHRHGESGLGIGLALAQALVDLHGGRIIVHSEGEGCGSTFEVTLPHDVLVAEPVRMPTDATSADVVQPVRILMVDDNQDAADMLASLLELKGHVVRVAYRGRAALDAAAAFEPQVVLLDVGMPELDGYEVARRLRAMPWADTMTLVAITGWGSSDDRQRTAAAGFDHHLTKPVDLQQVLALVAHGGKTR